LKQIGRVKYNFPFTRRGTNFFEW